MWQRTILESRLYYKTITEEEFKENYPEGPRQKKKDQEFELHKYMYLLGLTQHVSFGK